MDASLHMVSVEWLGSRIMDGSVRVVDCHYSRQPKPKQVPSTWRSALHSDGHADVDYRTLVRHVHIAGAVHADIEVYMKTASNGGRFEYWPAVEFQSYMRQHIGANTHDHIVLYDRGANWYMWPAKFWATLKHYGHERVSILRGGLDAWQAAQQATTAGTTPVAPGNWTGDAAAANVFTADFDLSASGNKDAGRGWTLEVLDARPSGEFAGTASGPACGRHVPNATSLPAVETLCDGDGLLPTHSLHSVISAALGADWSLPAAGQRYVCLCNSGVQAALLAFAMHAASGGAVLPAMHSDCYMRLVAEKPDCLVETKKQGFKSQVADIHF